MRTQHDLIAFYRHVLRSGDVALAGRVGRALMKDPAYRRGVLGEVCRLPVRQTENGRSTAGGRLLDSLLDHVDPLSDT